MPELPDVIVYTERLSALLAGTQLEAIRIASPFVLRSVTPPINALKNETIISISHIGKRIVWEFADDLFLVIHLMIAGRLRWRKKGTAVPRGTGLAAFDFAHGSLLFTEVAKKKRASLFVVHGRESLSSHDRGGIDVLGCSCAQFREAITAENHTLKRTLTDPRVLSGIGNAYSDEILHAARLSPLQLTRNLDDAEITRLHTATVDTLVSWIQRTRDEVGDAFPEKVTAFRDGMAVHGRYGLPCPECAAPIQRIVYAENEVNYCAKCQTNGRLLADRAFSKLLRRDWPKTLDEWIDGMVQRQGQ